jgi:hypothetical protein
LPPGSKRFVVRTLARSSAVAGVIFDFDVVDE